MTLQTFFTDTPLILDQPNFQQFLDVLRQKGYYLIGPTVRDGTIIYDEVTSPDDFPVGWTDDLSPGTYRLRPGPTATLFGYTLSPQSWKRFLHPPQLTLWEAHRTNGTFQVVPETQPPCYAFIGVRPCELQAIALQDKVFLQGDYVDPHYRARRESMFIVAVNCGQAGGTCFCASMNSGPQAAGGFDLALTEVIADGQHYYVVQVGTQRGLEVMNAIPNRAASAQEITAAETILADTAAHMGRELNTDGLKEIFYHNYESPRWDQVAKRCLTCGNCTLVCPTCFCTTIEDSTDLTGKHAKRVRKWDSCFTMDFSYIHGGSIRYSAKSRYRQWLAHKLATWVDQFGTFGCVGCGRCITWCPVGIDLTEEAQAIRESSNQITREVQHEDV